MSNDPTGPEEVREHLNFIERLVSGADSSDEYMEAIIRNQAVMISLMEGGGASVPVVGEFGVPPNTAGIAITGASEGDYAEFLYKTDGRTVVEGFQTYSDITSGEVAIVNDDGLLEPKSDVDQGDLDFGNVAASTTNAGAFSYYDTEDNVTVAPGEKKVILEANVSGGGALFSIGTKDDTYTLYQYYIDGEKLLDEPMKKPLGLYNDMFQFPKPIKVNQKIEVEIQRQEDAGAASEYFSNVVLM